MDTLYYYIGFIIFWSFTSLCTVSVISFLYVKNQWFRRAIEINFWYWPGFKFAFNPDRDGHRSILFLINASKRNAHIRNMLPLLVPVIKLLSK